jgi:hypothetical protein
MFVLERCWKQERQRGSFVEAKDCSGFRFFTFRKDFGLQHDAVLTPGK